jgi:hypothetical protein
MERWSQDWLDRVLVPRRDADWQHVRLVQFIATTWLQEYPHTGRPPDRDLGPANTRRIFERNHSTVCTTTRLGWAGEISRCAAAETPSGTHHELEPYHADICNQAALDDQPRRRLGFVRVSSTARVWSVCVAPRH